MAPPAALKACALFRGFTETGLAIVAGIAAERSYAAGVPLFAEKMVGDSLLIIGKGKVKLSCKVASGEEVVLGEVGPGDYLGELSLIQQGQRMCTAIASGPVIAYEIRHADFQKLMTQKPQACLKLLMSVVALFGQKVADNQETFKALLARK